MYYEGRNIAFAAAIFPINQQFDLLQACNRSDNRDSNNREKLSPELRRSIKTFDFCFRPSDIRVSHDQSPIQMLTEVWAERQIALNAVVRTLRPRPHPLAPELEHRDAINFTTFFLSLTMACPSIKTLYLRAVPEESEVELVDHTVGWIMDAVESLEETVQEDLWGYDINCLAVYSKDEKSALITMDFLAERGPFPLVRQKHAFEVRCLVSTYAVGFNGHGTTP